MIKLCFCQGWSWLESSLWSNVSIHKYSRWKYYLSYRKFFCPMKRILFLHAHFSSHFYFEVQLSRYPGSIRSTLPWSTLRAPRSDSALLLLSGAVGNPSGSEVTAGELEEWRHLVAETETSAELKESEIRFGIRMTTNAFKMCVYSIFIIILKNV